MPDQDFVFDREQSLSHNTLTRDGGYVFAGWATNETGSVVYFDNHFVSNLVSTEGDIVTLYAVWVLPGRVQLWEGGPYWATMNLGAENPEDSGLYFWWGDIVGYRREGDTWVASDGSSQDLLFYSDNVPTYGKSNSSLQSEGWITAEGVLAPEHDAAHVRWNDAWRMPTIAELNDLISNCDWTWTTQGGVNGSIVRGRGEYASASIFLPAAGYGYGSTLYINGLDGWCGYYWSSVPNSGNSLDALHLIFVFEGSLGSLTSDFHRLCGLPVRPVQGFTE